MHEILQPGEPWHHFHDCGRRGSEFEHAIYVQRTRDVKIIDNAILRSASFAVHLYGSNRGAEIAMMLDNGGGVIIAGYGGNVSTRTVVTRNVIGGSHRSAGIQAYWAGPPGRDNRATDSCLSGDLVDSSNGGFNSVRNLITPAIASAASCQDVLGSTVGLLGRALAS
ncbi:MAG: hypothetical protein WKF94_00990 [Solirubrobacteraceae bacterium]